MNAYRVRIKCAGGGHLWLVADGASLTNSVYHADLYPTKREAKELAARWHAATIIKYKLVKGG